MRRNHVPANMKAQPWLQPLPAVTSCHHPDIAQVPSPAGQPASKGQYSKPLPADPQEAFEAISCQWFNCAAFESIPTVCTPAGLLAAPAQGHGKEPMDLPYLHPGCGSLQVLTPGLSLLQPQIHLTPWVQPPPRSMLSTG